VVDLQHRPHHLDQLALRGRTPPEIGAHRGRYSILVALQNSPQRFEFRFALFEARVRLAQGGGPLLAERVLHLLDQRVHGCS
jgi:hypothetical protein